jgi:hypothetical protein
MIIDSHCHWHATFDWLPDAWWDSIARVVSHSLKAMGMEMTLETAKQAVLPGLIDPKGETLLGSMDEAGVDKTVLLPLDFGLASGEPKVSYEEQNWAHAELQSKYPDRIISFASVDPRRPEAVKFIEKAIKEWGLKGYKLHPGAGFAPDSPESYRLLEKVAELGVPVIAHTGQFNLYDRYNDPVYLDRILVDFPDLTIITAHMGEGWYNTLFAMAQYKPNLATDFCRWQRPAAQNYHHFCERLRHALDSFGSDRVLYGTDGPYLRLALSDKDYVQLVKDLPTKAPEGITFTEAEVEAMLGGNAARILGISK